MGDTLAPEAKTAATVTFTEFNVRQDTGKPHFIRLCDGVVERLERDSDIKKGEAFGILLGTVESDTNCTITVEAFEPAGVVEQHIRAWTPQPGSVQQVVGYYRSHLRSGFTLDEADRALFERCFPKEPRVALLVKPPKPVPGTGTFFLGEDGFLDEKRVTVEFPFDLGQLTAEQPVAVAAAPAPAPPAPRGLPGGIFAKIAITGIVVAASVVGLSALGVFEPSANQPEPMDFPKPAPPAPPAISMPVSKKPAPSPAAKPVPKARPEIVEKAPALPSPGTTPDGSTLYTPPYAMRQFAPILSDSVRQAIKGEVVVRVRVNVDASGAVVGAEPVADQAVAEPLLTAATIAVKRWKFEPAQRGGQRIASETVLSFTFRK